MTVTIKTNPQHSPFKGFIMQARQEGSNTAVGIWKLTKDNSEFLQTIDCYRISDTIANKLYEEQKELVLEWISPDELNGSIYFIATVMQEVDIYWLEIKSVLLMEKTMSLLTFGKSSCLTLKPEETDIMPQLSKPPFIIIPSIDSYGSHQEIDVTILSLNENKILFEGFMIQAHLTGSIFPVGKWSLTSETTAEIKTCFNENDTATNGMLFSNHFTLSWHPPITALGPIIFSAAVIKEDLSYWSPINSIPIVPLSKESSENDFIGFEYYSGCFFLKPTIVERPQLFAAEPYQIKTVRNSDFSENSIKVTLHLKNSENIPFKAFILQARKTGSKKQMPFGSFTIPSTSQNSALKSCVAKDDTVINLVYMDTREIQVLWKHPTDQQEPFYFIATVIQNNITYWEEISSEVIDLPFQEPPIIVETDYCKQPCAERYPLFSYSEMRSLLTDIKNALKRVEKRLQDGCDSCTHLCNKAYPPDKNKEIKSILIIMRDNLQKTEKTLRSRCDGPSNCKEVELLGFTKSGKYFIKKTKESLLSEVDCKF